jgi:shikimate dehydrogenase
LTLPYAEVIGDPIAHSKSPLIHGFWLDKLGIAAEYRKTLVRADELEAFLAQRRGDPDWRGCNITIPHKESAFALLGSDGLGEGEPAFGAINTIVRHPNAVLRGYNTDLKGVVGPLSSYLDRFGGLAVAILGAGGAARAALYGLASLAGTQSLTILARRPEQAEVMLQHLPRSLPTAVKPIDSASLEGIDLLVNASPLGMIGKPPLDLSLDAMRPEHPLVFDMVYAPLETDLLRRARAAGIETIDGLQMLVGQAAYAFELFFGQPAPRAHDAELRALLTA